MIEAVGWQYFDTFFRRCGGLLGPRGLMLLQAIMIDDRAYEVEKASRSFIRELIFPSGCLPSLEVISRCVARDKGLADAQPGGPHAPLRGDPASLARALRTSGRAPPSSSAMTGAFGGSGSYTSHTVKAAFANGESG